MEYVWTSLESFFLEEETVKTAIRVGVLALVGLPLVYALGRSLRRAVARRIGSQQGLLAGKAFIYLGLLFIGVAVLKELNFPLDHILGAAGIAGLALGFASQTSVSNVISGVFLMTEQPFVIGDVVRVGDTTGEVLSIDTLSIKLRTFDNRFVRIPNETIIKSELHNITRFPIRRIDLNVGVAYKEQIGQVRRVLLDIAHRNPLCLQEPEAQVMLSGFGSSSVDILFAVWVQRQDFVKIKNQLIEQVKQRFDEEGIEIPFPHLSLYQGEAGKPFPIQIVEASTRQSSGKS